MNRTFATLLTAGLLLTAATAARGDEAWPAGLSFAGLTAGRWQLYVVPAAGAEPQPVATALEPRTPTFAPAAGKIAYIGADGSLREITLADGAERVVLSADAQRTFTQPAYDADGQRLFVVVLKAGASVDTDIAQVNGGHLKSVITQRSAQFEPRFHSPDMLFYANVHCTEGCGKIIQEIWRMHLISGEAEQITLVNAIAREPVVSYDGRRLYFASNKNGNFHIWRLELADGSDEQLTTGAVTDTSPALDQAGALYFIRRSPAGVQLLRWQDDGPLQPLPLPAAIEDLRDLEINP